MSHLDDQKREIEERWDVLALLEAMGVSVKRSQTRRTNIEAHCPFHDDQGRPNLSININRGSRGYGCYHCFACLEENEPIWTERGLLPIREVKVGDRVLDLYGAWQFVTHTQSKPVEKLLGIETASYRGDPLWLTPDHPCFYVEQEDAIANLPYLRRRSESNCRHLKYYKKLKTSSRTRFRHVSIREGEASALKIGDYLLFPRTPEKAREDRPLASTVVPVAPPAWHQGQRKLALDRLPVNPDTAWLYGMYLAEGSVGRGFVCFSLNADEKDTLAARIVETLAREFSLPATVAVRPERSVCTVHVCKTDLAQMLGFWFGEGAGNKKLPAASLNWSVECQDALLEGYRDGDGDRKGASATVSPALGAGLFALAIQSGEWPSLTRKEAYTDKTGQAHQATWALWSRCVQGAKGFYESIDGVLYYVMPITAIHERRESVRVVDITVAQSHSFVTKVGAVHNCSARGHLWSLIMQYRSCGFEDAKQWAADACRITLSAPAGEGQRLSNHTRVQRARRFYCKWAQQELQMDLEALGYLFDRGVTMESITRFQIGFCSKEGRLQLPAGPDAPIRMEDLLLSQVMEEYNDDAGTKRIKHVLRNRILIPIMAGRDVEDIQGRTLEPEPPKWLDEAGTVRNPAREHYRKYRNLKGVEKGVWGLNTIGPDSDIVFVGEGPFDAILSAQAGVPSLALLGTDLITVIDALDGVLPHRTGICLGGDADDAGAQLIERAGKLLMERGIPLSLVTEYDGANDPADYLSGHSADAWRRKVHEAEPFPVFLARRLTAEQISRTTISTRAFEPILALLTYMDCIYAMQVIEQMEPITAPHGVGVRHLQRTFLQMRR